MTISTSSRSSTCDGCSGAPGLPRSRPSVSLRLSDRVRLHPRAHVFGESRPRLNVQVESVVTRGGQDSGVIVLHAAWVPSIGRLALWSEDGSRSRTPPARRGRPPRRPPPRPHPFAL